MARQRMTGEQRKQQIIDVAALLFSENGFKATTTKLISLKAGISEAVIYQHFPSKDDLYDATIDYLINRVKEIAESRPVVSAGSFEELLTLIGVNLLKYAEESIVHSRMMLYSALQDHRFSGRFFASVTIPLLQTIASQIDLGKKEGRIDPTINSFEAAFSFLSNMLIMNLGRNIVKVDELRKIDLEPFIKQTVKIFIRGISKER